MMRGKHSLGLINWKTDKIQLIGSADIKSDLKNNRDYLTAVSKGEFVKTK